MSKLYIVGTPIGNLGDFSPRAVETLNNCDFIAAEDTRVTVKLLNHFGVKKNMVSYFEHNRRERGEKPSYREERERRPQTGRPRSGEDRGSFRAKRGERGERPSAAPRFNRNSGDFKPLRGGKKGRRGE